MDPSEGLGANSGQFAHIDALGLRRISLARYVLERPGVTRIDQIRAG